MTPLIDVVFQLLIFLMVSSQFIKPDRQVDLPAGPLDSAPGNPDTPHLSLVITAENIILLEGEETSKAELANKLRDAIKHSDIDSLVIRSGQKADVGVLLPVIEIARENGIMGIAYEKKNELTE